MLCEKCKVREANIKYTEIINGVKTEHNLCSHCAKEMDFGQYTALLDGEFPLGKLLSGLLGLEEDEEETDERSGWCVLPAVPVLMILFKTAASAVRTAMAFLIFLSMIRSSSSRAVKATGENSQNIRGHRKPFLKTMKRWYRLMFCRKQERMPQKSSRKA